MVKGQFLIFLKFWKRGIWVSEKLEVGQEYIDDKGTIYKIDVISMDYIVSYSICDNREKSAYYHAGSAHMATIKQLVAAGQLVPLSKASKVLYGRD